jgi:hypothetical protein
MTGEHAPAREANALAEAAGGPGARAATPPGRDATPPRPAGVSANAHVGLAVAATLLACAAINLPELGSDGWPFRPGEVRPTGPLAWLARLVDGRPDLGLPRAAAMCAALIAVGYGVTTLARGRSSLRGAVAVGALGALLLLVPATAIQLALRSATAPWFYTNDSTYQIELAGDLVLRGESPYGHDWRGSGLERFYTFDGSRSPRIERTEPALDHFAYPPASALSGALWRLLPAPFDDYRLFVLLATLAAGAAALGLSGPPAARAAVAVFLVANPIAVRSVWFGQNDAPALALSVLACALALRGRAASALAALALAGLFKQFALFVAPFVAVIVAQRAGGRALARGSAVAVAVLVAASLPFFVASPSAFASDVVGYGAATYRIVGYGLAGILVEIGAIGDRRGYYPFVPLFVTVWLPLTAWLTLRSWRDRSAGAPLGYAAAALTVLLFIGRTFNNYYLVWPLTFALCALPPLAAERERVPAPPLDRGTSA